MLRPWWPSPDTWNDSHEIFAFMTKNRIYLSPPDVGSAEIEHVLEAFQSNWIAPAGPNLDAFEEDFAILVGSKHAVAVSSGTAALHLALRLAGVGPGDEVLCSSLTFIASAASAAFSDVRQRIDAQPSGDITE